MKRNPEIVVSFSIFWFYIDSALIAKKCLVKALQFL